MTNFRSADVGPVAPDAAADWPGPVEPPGVAWPALLQALTKMARAPNRPSDRFNAIDQVLLLGQIALPTAKLGAALGSAPISSEAAQRNLPPTRAAAL